MSLTKINVAYGRVVLTNANVEAEEFNSVREPIVSIAFANCTSSNWRKVIAFVSKGSLIQLKLTGCPISNKDIEPLKRAANLQVLELDQNNISGSDVEWLSPLEELRRLTIRRNPLNEHEDINLLLTLASRRSLKKLVVPFTNIHKLAQDSRSSEQWEKLVLPNLPALSALELKYGVITEQKLEHYTKWAIQLKRVSLQNISLSSIGVQILARVAQLQGLQADSCNVTDQTLLSIVTSLPLLRELLLPNNKITSYGLRTVKGKLANLTQLSLRHNPIDTPSQQPADGTQLSGIGELAGQLPRIRQLDLQTCSGNPRTLRGILDSAMPDLEGLRIGSSMHDSPSKSVCERLLRLICTRFPKLVELAMSWKHILPGQWLYAARAFSSLKVLRIKNWSYNNSYNINTEASMHILQSLLPRTLVEVDESGDSDESDYRRYTRRMYMY